MRLEKRVTIIYSAVLLAVILYAFFAAFSFRNTIETRAEHKGVAVWRDEMEMTQEDGIFYFRRILPECDFSDRE